MEKKKIWCGDAPSNCDICDCKITDTFIDGRTRMGPWGNMCPTCHVSHGIGLGTGKGQKYVFDDLELVWVKIEG